MLSPLVAMLILAASESPPAKGVAEAEPNKSEAKVCQVFEQIGSRLGNRRVCMTASQWEQKQQEERSDVQKVQSNVGVSAD